MRYLVLLFLSVPALADPSPVPSAVPTSPDQVIDMLASSLTLAKNLPGALGAIFVALVALALAVLMIAKYFADRNKRETEAYETDLRVRQIQTENLARMQRDATDALISNMDISYKQDFDYFTQKIQEGKFDSVYVKIAPKFHPTIAAFIYDASLPPADRAARIIMTIGPQ